MVYLTLVVCGVLLYGKRIMAKNVKRVKFSPLQALEALRVVRG
jgi:hypothetical protein